MSKNKRHVATLDPTLSAALTEWCTLDDSERERLESDGTMPARLWQAATLRAMAGISARYTASMRARATERARRPSYAAQWAAVMRAPNITSVVSR